MTTKLLSAAVLYCFAAEIPAIALESPPDATPLLGISPGRQHRFIDFSRIFMTIIGLCGLSFECFQKNVLIRRASLVSLLIGASLGLLAYWQGRQAFPFRLNAIGMEWHRLHATRAAQVLWLFCLVSSSCIAALVTERRSPRLARILTILAGAAAAATILTSAWVAGASERYRRIEMSTGETLRPITLRVDPAVRKE